MFGHRFLALGLAALGAFSVNVLGNPLPTGTPGNCAPWAGPFNGASSGHHTKFLIDYDAAYQRIVFSPHFTVEVYVDIIEPYGTRTVEFEFINTTLEPKHVLISMLREYHNDHKPVNQQRLDGQIGFRTLDEVVHHESARTPGPTKICINLIPDDVKQSLGLAINLV